MLKKLWCAWAFVWAAVASAAVDVNKATAAELDGIKGIGPSLSGQIVDERKKSNFKDWPDFISRVKGMGDKNAAKFSSEGLTVNGAGFKGDAPAAAPAAAKAAPAAKAAAAAMPATPAAPAAAPAAVKK
jgi:competence protein ComEA